MKDPHVASPLCPSWKHGEQSGKEEAQPLGDWRQNLVPVRSLQTRLANNVDKQQD